jgi:hypothetical protein
MVPDLVFAGCPTNVIVGAMKRMASKTGHAGWVTNIQQAKLAYRMEQTQSNRPSTQPNPEWNNSTGKFPAQGGQEPWIISALFDRHFR